MKEYKTEKVKMNRVSSIMIEEMLTHNAPSKWVLNQVVMNETVDEYIVILEREKDY